MGEKSAVTIINREDVPTFVHPSGVGLLIIGLALAASERVPDLDRLLESSSAREGMLCVFFEIFESLDRHGEGINWEDASCPGSWHHRENIN